MKNALDNPMMNIMVKLYDLCWLNVLTFVCCLPVVTAGAAMTALHSVLLKMAKDEEGTITKAYFKEFKENLKGSVVGWLIFLAALLVLIVDLYYWTNSSESTRSLFWGVTIVLLGMLFAVMSWYFSVRAKFVDTSISGIKRAINYSLYFLPASVIMGGATLFVLWVLTQNAPLVFLLPFGLISLLEYPKVIYIRKVFDRLLTQAKDNE